MSDGYHCYTTPGDAGDIAVRALRLIDAVQRKMGEIDREPLTVGSYARKRYIARVAELPLPDLEATAAKLEKYVARHGCSAVRCSGEDYTLSDIVERMRTTLADAAAFRALLAAEGPR